MYNKIRKLKKGTSLLMALVFLFAFFLSNSKAYADDLSEPIRVSQKISINTPYAKPQDSFTYILEAVSKDAPLPEGESGSYKFSLRGDETKDLSITFTKAGEYTYKLYQEKSDIENVTQDKEVYTIIIRIGEVDGKLVKEVLVIKNSSGKKVENIEFHNIYKIEEETPAVPEKPGDTDKPDKPEKPEKPEKPQNPEKPNKRNDKKDKTKTMSNVKTGVREIGFQVLLIMLIAIGALKVLDKSKNKINVN